jgi:GDP-L-fucose synthase
MNKLRILLTGGGGMVGRNLLEHSGISEFDMIVPNSRELDLRDYHAVQSYLKKYQPDMVIHAAGKVGGIHANMREPVSFLMDNLDMGRNIVWAAHQSGVKKLINLGSSCMFPRNHSEPLKEEMVLKGELESTNEGYALAKIVTARLCEYVMKENGDYQYKTLIPCNIYGRFDKFDPAHSHLIPAIIHKIHQAKLSGSSSVEIWGDGRAKREFMYAGDLAHAIFQAINHFDTLPNYLNVGLGHDYTINEYYEAVAKVIGYKGNFVHDVSKPVGMSRKLVDIEKQTLWGWQAKTSLQIGINKTYEFYLRDFCNEL